MKSPKKNGIGEVVTDYGRRVMKIFKKGLLQRSLFDFYGDIKADSVKIKESSSVPSTPTDGDGGVIYTKSADGKLYYKSNEVSEVELSSSSTTTTNIAVTDNASTNENNAIVFVADADIDGSTNAALESDGATLTYNPSIGQVNANVFSAANNIAIGSDVNITQINSNFHSLITLLEDANSDAGPIFTLKKTRGGSVAAQDNDEVGEIRFQSIDDKQPTPDAIIYSRIFSSILDASDGNEIGKLDISVANQGVPVIGFKIQGRDSVSGSTDVTLGSTDNCRVFIIGSSLESPDIAIKELSPKLTFHDDSASVNLGNIIGEINWHNDDNDSTTLKIIGQSTEAFSASAGGSKFSFWVTQPGSTTPWQALTINDDRSLDCANNVTIDGTGNLILKQNGSPAGQYSATFNVPALASNIILTTPTSTGTIALTSELPPNLTVDGAGTIHANNVPTLNQSTTGNAATATALETARTINGVSFDGTGNITVTAAGSTLSDTVTVAKGGTGATTASGARSNLGVDAAGTDNSTNVTLAGTPDYITISGQEITRNAIDLTADVSGTLPVANGGTGQTNLSNVTVGVATTAQGITGATDGDVTITSDGEVTVKLDSDDDEVLQKFKVTDNADAEVFSVNESGVVFMAGNTIGNNGSDNDLEIQSDGNMTFVIDRDNDETSQSFSFKNYNVEVANLDESGNLQIDGDLTVSGNDIKDSGGNTIISSDGSGVVTLAGGNIGFGTSGGSQNYNLNINSGSDIILEADQNGGGGDSTIQYPDSGGTNRIMLAADNDVVILSNRASNGTVQIRANTSTAGGSGEVTVVTVQDSRVDISKDLYVTGIITGKQREIYSQSFLDDLGTTKHYLPWKDINEQTTIYQEEAAMLMPCDGRIVSVTVKVMSVTGSGNMTIGVNTIAPNINAFGSANWTEEETETLAIESTDDYHVFHFAFDNAKHFDSGDLVSLSIQNDADLSSTTYWYVSTVVEYDWNTFLGTTSAEHDSNP